jgi:capsular exopolysaccharide synthesis family protein
LRRRGVYHGEQPYYGGHPYYGGVPYGSPYYGEGGGPPSPGFLGDLSPRRLLRVARRKWLTLALAVVFAGGTAAFYLHMATKVYSASTLIEMSVRRPRIMSQQGAVLEEQGWAPQDEIFNTRLEKFRSRALQELAVRRLRTLPAYASMPDDELAAIPAGVTFTLVRSSRLVRLTAESTNPTNAADAVNACAVAAEELMTEENRLASDNAVAWLQTQAAAQRKVLERADQSLVDFRSQNQIDAIEARIKVVGETLSEVSKTLADLENRRVLNRDLLSALEKVDLTPENVGKLPGETPRSTEILSAVGRHTAAIAARDALKSRLTPRHPEYVAAEKNIEELRAQAMDAVRQSRETVVTDGRLLEQQSASLKTRTEELSRESADLEMKAAQAKSNLAALEREREAADVSYKGILNRIEEARLSADENTAAVKPMDPAEPPERPVKPNPSRVLAVALVLGLGLGALLALLKDVLEDLLAHDEDVETQLGIKVLGVVPLLDHVERAEVARMCEKQKFSQFAESFAGLRSVLDSGEYAGYSRVLLVTSTVPEVGKTICSTNLAISFAQRGERTLVVDFDMRRPQIRRVFGIPDDHESLLHVLAAQDASRFDRLPFKTDIPGMDVICSRRGGKEHSAAEVIGGKFVKEFVDWASSRYDRVILDSPPYGIVSDAVVLAGYSTGVMLILRPEKTRKSPARNAVRHLAEVGATVLGCVVNGLDFKKATYFSNYDYHYSHHRYGYGDHYKEDQGAKGQEDQGT